MILAPGLRKFALTVHVIASIGWIGGVAAFLALAVVGLTSADPSLVRACRITMDLTYRMVVIPLGLASLTTGIISSLGTEWGLFRYYWVLVKLLLTIPAVYLMLIHLRLVEATASGFNPLSSWVFVLFAGAALVFLLTATVLSTYKPRGRTRYGSRKLAQRG